MFENGDRDGGKERSLSFPVTSTALAPPPRGDPRRSILDAIVRTIARRGYDRTTVSRIVRDAGVAEAVFSEHFHDKQDCFTQAVEELLSKAERRAIEQFERQAPWAERVRDGLATLLQALARDADGARVTFVEMLTASPAAQERHRRVLSLLTSLMDEGRLHATHSHCLPAQTSEAVVGGIASILHRRVLQNETATLPSLHADLTYFALLPYLGQEEAIEAAGWGAAS